MFDDTREDSTFGNTIFKTFKSKKIKHQNLNLNAFEKDIWNIMKTLKFIKHNFRH